MGWLILILVLLAAAFGVLGAVLKLTAILVLTVLLTIAVIGAIAWHSIRSQFRRWERSGSSRVWIGGPKASDGRDLPSHDDRY